jgi:hypothetical protein
MAEATEDNPIVFFDITLGGSSARDPLLRSIPLHLVLGLVRPVLRNLVAPNPTMRD